MSCAAGNLHIANSNVRPMDEAAVFGLIRRAVRVAGSQKAFALAHRIPEACLSQYLAGIKPPTERMLAAVGMRRVVTFEPLKGAK